jgi:hypothetical protein
MMSTYRNVWPSTMSSNYLKIGCTRRHVIMFHLLQSDCPRSVFACSNSGIVGSNPSRDMDYEFLLSYVQVVISRRRSPTYCA